MNTVILHPSADAEFQEAIGWYDEQKKGLGRRFYLSVMATMKVIEANPQAFGYSRKPFREASVRFFPYTIIYKISRQKKMVYVTAVYHTSRNPKSKYRS